MEPKFTRESELQGYIVERLRKMEIAVRVYSQNTRFKRQMRGSQDFDARLKGWNPGLWMKFQAKICGRKYSPEQQLGILNHEVIPAESWADVAEALGLSTQEQLEY